MKKYLTMATLICCYLVFPKIVQAQEKKVTDPKPILMTPANIVAESTIAVDKPTKVSAFKGIPDGNIAVVPVGGLVVPKPVTFVVAPKPATGLKKTPAPVNMDKPRMSTIKLPD